MQDITLFLSDLTEIDGKPMTDSLRVARRFGKDHKNVLRSIRAVIRSLPDEMAGLNFEPCSFSDENSRKRPMYRMTKDGFVILAMGFTGPEAMQWKIGYIAAFNKMAEQIATASRVPALPLTLHEQAMKLHGESETSKSLASIYGRGLRKRRDEKPVFERQLARLERAMQLCLMLGLDGLPDVD